MAAGSGHFEKGVWVEEKELPAPPAGDGDVMEKRLADATRAVIASIDNVMVVTRDLVTTDEGKQYLEKTMKETQRQIQQSVDGMVSRVRAELDKKKP